MATLVLTTVGRAVGGPLGAVAGAFAGSALDRAALGTGRRPTIGDLAIQGANYGDPLQQLFGTIRAGGQIIWSTGIEVRTGGGKIGSTRSYTASFAVALSARPIFGVGRVWADSRLIRGADGAMAVGGALRVHRGDPLQAPDPLIASAEGHAGTPAYRGLSYVVFEDLVLEEFGNRIPQLSFEVIADPAPVTVGRIARELALSGGDVEPAVTGLDHAPAGFAATRESPFSDWLDQLALLEPMSVSADGPRLALRSRQPAISTELDGDALGAGVAGAKGHRRDVREAGQVLPAMTSLIYLDVERDLQPGLQRSGLRRGGPELREMAPAALTAAEAKAVVERLARERAKLRETRSVRAPLRLATLEPGDLVSFPEEAMAWRVERATLAGLSIDLDLVAIDDGALTPAMLADPGRVDPNPLPLHGPTLVVASELPTLHWEPAETPRVLVAAAGVESHWRRAEVLISVDDGSSWLPAGTVTRPSILGTGLTVLGDGPTDRWDEVNAVDVQLDSADGWLERRGRASVLAGGNLALLGRELLHFAEAAPIGPRRFRLSGLLRGRFGTETEASSHAPSERFVVLDPGGLVRVDVAPHLMGGSVLLKAVGPTDAEGDVATYRVELDGQSVRPYRPHALQAARLAEGAVSISWLERGRAWTAWPDAVPASGARFVVSVTAGLVSRTFDLSADVLVISASEQLSWFGAPLTAFTVEVAQTQQIAGIGASARRSFVLPLS